MLFLVTGTPGATKTLNTIKYINEQKQFSGRDVYYFGIKDLDPKYGWKEMSDDQARNWYKLPVGAVLLFDEAYNIFPTKHGAQGTPEHVKQLATHRHLGMDIFLVCQKVTGQLDSFVRGLVNRHQHYERIMGSLQIKRFSWDLCQSNPDSSAARKLANRDTISTDKTYFGTYHSADVHTHTLSVPWKMIGLFGLALVVCVFMAWRAVSILGGDDAMTDNQKVAAGVVGGSVLGSSASKVEKRQLSMVELFTPEVPELPWTAPVYRAQVEKASDWPRPAACMIRERNNDCQCYTQQGTKLHLEQNICHTIAREGYFDHTRSATLEAGRGGAVGRGVAPPGPAPSQLTGTGPLSLNSVTDNPSER